MASGDSLVSWGPRDGLPPAANPTTPDTRNDNPVLEFDATTAESAYFGASLPANYAGGGITATIVWAADTATTGSVVWGLSFERHQDGTDTIASDSFATEQTATSPAPGTAGIYKYRTIAFTNGAQIDSLAVGEHFRVKLRRLPADGADDMTGDAQFVNLELKET